LIVSGDNDLLQLGRDLYCHSSGRGIEVAGVVMGLQKVRLPHDNLIATAAPPRLEGPRDGRPGAGKNVTQALAAGGIHEGAVWSRVESKPPNDPAG
jgi:hypothetical protein